MLFLMLLLLAASPAAAQTACPTGTVFVPNAQPQAGDVSLPGFQGVCRRQAQAPAGGQAPRPGQRPADSTATPGFTR
jgi:hypothetical protein